jgi:hypothetical protein
VESQIELILHSPLKKGFMRKIKLFGLSLILGLIFQGEAVFAQGDIGVIGLMTGRITKENGRGVSGAVVSVIAIGQCFEWQGNMVRTNPFGYYRVYVHFDCVLLATPSRKGLSFTPNSVIIPLDSTYQNINFTSN